MVTTPAGGGAIAPPPDPVNTAILNLFLGGVGYLVLGQKAKGIAAIVLCVLFFFPPSCGVVSGLVALFAAVDAYQQAGVLQRGGTIGQWTFFKNAAA